ncbi:MAG TPA: class I SAM-dependent rRNA methyltransferase [Planctomycetota bacterium]|nr:class I SAM-dependent rRNA methyltransferase [Planctomycetota bacterium]
MRQVRLKTDKFGVRPWVFRKMVARPDGVEDGDIVEVLDRSGRFVGTGFYNGRSTVALRFLDRGARREIDDAYFRKALRDAIYLRRSVLDLERVTDAYRVVHSEGDGLSGLIVDRYADVLVIEPTSIGFWRLAPRISALLREAFPGTETIVRVDERVAGLEGFDAGPPPPSRLTTIRESGLSFRVDAGAGHKTGFFLDQRDHRARFAGYCRGKTVLDGCCYTGGFGIHARARGGAGRVLAVDLDEKALDLARENAAANGAAVEFVHADLFDFLRQAAAGPKFDAAVLDPPKLASDRDGLPRALAFLRDLNALAIRVLKNNGLLLTCCCTGLVSPSTFLGTLRKAAAIAGSEIRFHEVGGASPDHPVAPNFPESRYLTAVYASVRAPL